MSRPVALSATFVVSPVAVESDVGRQRERHPGVLVQVRAPWHESDLLEEVNDEASVETMRWNEFAAFVAPTDPSCEPDPEFTLRLREHLRGLVRRRYTS